MGEIEVLLHQHNSHAAAATEQGDDTLDVFDGRGLDAFGRFVKKQKPRTHDQGAGYGELLLLTAREIAAPPPQHGEQDGKQFENLIRQSARGARQAGKTGTKVLLDREQRKYLAALRNDGNAGPRPGGGGQPGDVPTGERDAAGLDRIEPRDGAQQAGFPSKRLMRANDL